MNEKVIEKYLVYFIMPILLGMALGYMISGIATYLIPTCTLSSDGLKISSDLMKKNDFDRVIKVVLENDVFGIKKGIKTVVKKKKIVKVVSSINGYKLVGFVSGSNPMALFKKMGKPIVIVTEKKGIDNVWILDKVTKDGVYLRNKITREEKKFEFPVRVTNISLFGKKIKVKYNTDIGNSSIQKITVGKNVLKQVSNINMLLKQINIVPVFKDGRAFGYRINYIVPNSVLRKIGLRNGDIIVSINGEPTTSPDKIMNLYSQLNDMTSVNLDIIRNGKKKTIFINIE